MRTKQNFHTLLMLWSCIAVIEAKRGFLLTVPKVLFSGSEEKACVTFHDLDSDVNLILSLTSESGSLLSTHQESFPSGTGRCFHFKVPEIPASIKRATINVKGSSKDYSFEESHLIGLERSNLLTFIETDKPIYKPGQTVKFRILRLDQDLKPRLENVDEVWIEDPSGTRIAQWKQLETKQGLADLQMALSSEPVLGTWKISTKYGNDVEQREFKVEEYVLPKFEVSVNMPSYVLIDASEIKGEICAKYTYGKPVSGTVKAKVCIQQSYYTSRARPCAIIQKKKIMGCTPFSVSSDEVHLSKDLFSIWDAKVAVQATVEEDGTGVVLNGTADYAKVERTAVKINLKDHSKEYFKPGIKFVGKCVVTLPNGHPAPQEVIELSLSHYATNLSFKQNYTTDDKGEFSYTLPAMSNKVKSFSIQALAVLHQMKFKPGHYHIEEARAYHFVKKWFSPSGRFLQISPIKGVIECGEKMRVMGQYTTGSFSDVTFFYQVISRGNIVWTSQKCHIFRQEGVEEISDSSEMIPSKPNQEDEDLKTEVGPRKKIEAPSTKPSGKRHRQKERRELNLLAEFHMDVPITSTMAPVANLLVYYAGPDGEVVADSSEFQVEKCFNNSVSFDFSDEQVMPGEGVTVEITAAPGSLCAIGVVDKSALLLGTNNQLSTDKVYGSLQRFQLENFKPYLGPETYCREQLRKKKKVPTATLR